jgi:hypothetical protein
MQSHMSEPPAADDFQKSDAVLASQKAPTFERPDWSLFRTLEGLQQRAGVPKYLLSRLVFKELADNGLDNGAQVAVKALAGGYLIEDDDTGIDGAPEDIARLFSIGRPMVSSKLLRLPTRGALGNGLRVVAGAVLASEGTLIITTRNRRIALRPERARTADGTLTRQGAAARRSKELCWLIAGPTPSDGGHHCENCAPRKGCAAAELGALKRVAIAGRVIERDASFEQSEIEGHVTAPAHQRRVRDPPAHGPSCRVR